MLRIHWGVVAFIAFLHLMIGVGIGLAAPRANASVTDTPTRICGLLDTGHSLVDLQDRQRRAGVDDFSGGAQVGIAVRDHCPALREQVIAQLPDLEGR